MSDVFYVGRTSKTLQDRLAQHFYGAKRQSRRGLKNKKINELYFLVKITVLQRVRAESLAIKRERYWMFEWVQL
jgi:hypothetical protein